ncbi:MAG: hypothetical protein JST36_01980 [Bacteroidetes bacterium]|nr:hypothetical protein [Bacteroidota bacterium]
MRKYAILFAAGALVSLSACSDNSNNTPTQAQIDSAANAAAAAREAQMKATNDSLINAMAVMKADSAAKADSLAKVAAFEAGKAAANAKHAKSTKTKTKVVAKKPETVGNGKPKMGGHSDANTVGNGKPKMGGAQNPNTVGNGKPRMGGGN